MNNTVKKGKKIVIDQKNQGNKPIDPDELQKDCIILCLSSSLFHHLHLKFKVSKLFITARLFRLPVKSVNQWIDVSPL